MKISNYFAKEKMDDASFIQTYIEKLSDLTDEDICWANSDLEEDHEKVQSLLMEMVLSFYCFRETKRYVKKLSVTFRKISCF